LESAATKNANLSQHGCGFMDVGFRAQPPVMNAGSIRRMYACFDAGGAAYGES
jgi:hypothetical protein